MVAYQGVILCSMPRTATKVAGLWAEANLSRPAKVVDEFGADCG